MGRVVGDDRGEFRRTERRFDNLDADAVVRTVAWVSDRMRVDRLEATVEAHVMAAAQAREALGIPGTSVRTAWLCRDKPAMKAARVLQSDIPDEVLDKGVIIDSNNTTREEQEALRLADLRGFAELMMDFAEEPPELQTLIDVVLAYNLRGVSDLSGNGVPDVVAGTQMLSGSGGRVYAIEGNDTVPVSLPMPLCP